MQKYILNMLVISNKTAIDTVPCVVVSNAKIFLSCYNDRVNSIGYRVRESGLVVCVHVRSGFIIVCRSFWFGD